MGGLLSVDARESVRGMRWLHYNFSCLDPS
jgi:hypothetical protein